MWVLVIRVRLPSLVRVLGMCRVRIVGLVVVVRVGVWMHRRLWRCLLVVEGVIFLLPARVRRKRYCRSDMARTGRQMMVHHAGGGGPR